MDPRENKLPKWAQEKLQMVRRQRDEVTEKFEEILAVRGECEEGIFYVSVLNQEHTIPKYSRLYVRHGDMQVSITLRKSGIHINADKTIAITPVASNCVDIVKGE